MKKSISMVLVIALVLTFLAGCSGKMSGTYNASWTYDGGYTFSPDGTWIYGDGKMGGTSGTYTLEGNKLTLHHYSDDFEDEVFTVDGDTITSEKDEYGNGGWTYTK